MAELIEGGSTRACLYNVEWQIIRVGMLGSWNTVREVVDNIAELARYIQQVNPEIKSDRAEAASRYYRVINYMNAIRMGYSGQGLTGSTQDNMVREFRDSLQKEQDKYKLQQHSKAVDGIEQVKCDLQSLYWDDPECFKNILNNLNKRKTVATKRHNTTKHRPELVSFVELMEAIK